MPQILGLLTARVPVLEPGATDFGVLLVAYEFDVEVGRRADFVGKVQSAGAGADGDDFDRACCSARLLQDGVCLSSAVAVIETRAGYSSGLRDIVVLRRECFDTVAVSTSVEGREDCHDGLALWRNDCDGDVG